ncbi:MAG: aquaporin [Alphaproteobacteria bacterium]
MQKMIAEFLGTFTLVLFGCGAAVLAGGAVGQLGIAFAFGLAIVAMAYGIGPISGCHVNPAVSLGVFFAGRMSSSDLVKYIIAQFAGAVAGAAVLYVLASGAADYDIAASGLGQNGYGEASAAGHAIVSAIVFEFVATFIFLVTILGVTAKGQPNFMAGVAIGLTLTLIHIVGIRITGVSVNPARSFGPALFAGPTALAQLPLFLIVPSLGGIAAGILFKTGIFTADTE